MRCSVDVSSGAVANFSAALLGGPRPSFLRAAAAHGKLWNDTSLKIQFTSSFSWSAVALSAEFGGCTCTARTASSRLQVPIRRCSGSTVVHWVSCAYFRAQC